MPMPFTRPLQVTQASAPTGPLARGGSPELNLAPSNGITLPAGGGIVHTVKDPTKAVPMRNRTGAVVGAAVT